MVQLLIITGMSGAGKSSVFHILEDIGYYCIDNMPPTLISNFVVLCQNSNIALDKIAFVADARSGNAITRLSDEVSKLKKAGNSCELIYLEASNEALIKRYKETRRKHPHANDGSLVDGIETERELLSGIKELADYVIDTSDLAPKVLRDRVLSFFETHKKVENIRISIMSFGFKRGIPLDSDPMFDVRFLPNPYYDEVLKEQTGLDAPVRDYVLKWDVTKTFIEKLNAMIEFLLPQYIEEGKSQLVISIGCTGGKHRSVAVAEELGQFLTKKNYYATVTHRDIQHQHI